MRLYTFFSVFFLCCFSLAQAQSIIVDAFTDCWVVMISHAETEGDRSGWWGIWHKRKADKAYFHTPHVFNKLKPGMYTMVVYNPASEDFDPNSPIIGERSDGLTLHNIIVEDKGDTTLEFYFKRGDFRVWNCLSCPWLYVYDGERYVRETEVLKDRVGFVNRTTTSVTLSPNVVVDFKVRMRLQEEKDETTYLDRCIVKIGALAFAADGGTSEASRKLADVDRDYVILKKGDYIDIEFTLPSSVVPGSQIVLETFGFYEPDPAFLQSVYESYSRKEPDQHRQPVAGLSVTQGPVCPALPW